MKLVIEGTDRFRKIISVGLDNVVYKLEANQGIRYIKDWEGRVKAECHWDEEEQKITDEPCPLTLEEIAEKEKKTPKEEIELIKERLDKLEKVDEPRVPEERP